MPSPRSEKDGLLSDSLRSKLKGLSSWDVLKPIHDRFQKKAWEKSPSQWMSYVDLNVRLPELLLMRVDTMSMGVSLQGRVPFLDHRFVELAMSIPEAVKTRGGVLSSVGWFEIGLGLAILAWPWQGFLLVAFVWKVGTEWLRPLAGEPVWEFIERGGSYAAPLALLWLRGWPGGLWACRHATVTS